MKADESITSTHSDDKVKTLINDPNEANIDYSRYIIGKIVSATFVYKYSCRDNCRCYMQVFGIVSGTLSISTWNLSFELE